MNVCVIRNAEAESNSDIIRSIDAFSHLGINLLLLTRTRSTEFHRHEVLKKSLNYNDKLIDNYEIQMNSEMDKGLKNLFKLFKYQMKVAFWLIKNRDKFDTVHSYDLDTGLPTLIACKFINKQFVYHISDFFVESRSGIPEKLKNLVRKLEYSVINRAQATIICTEERKEQIKGSTPKALYVIHNSPVNIANYNADNDVKSEKIKLSYVGGLINVRFISEVLEIISKDDNFYLELAGIGPLSCLAESYSKQYSNIDFLGKVSYEEALKIYSKTDLMFAIYDPAVPNHKFSAPNKVYEAMMLGKPIIVAKDSGVDKIVDKEKIGFVINYSKDDFQNLLKSIVENPSQLELYSSNSKEAYKKYSWEAMKDKYKEIYDSIQHD